MNRFAAAVSLLLSCSCIEQDTSETLDGERVEVLTQAGYNIVADYYPASEPGRPAVLLVPRNVRSDFPLDFIETLHSHDWSVITYDPGGSGESSGPLWSGHGAEGLPELGAISDLLKADGVTDLAVVSDFSNEALVNAYAYQAHTLQESLMPTAVGYISPSFSGSQSLVGFVVQLDLFPDLPRLFANADTPEYFMEIDPGCWEFVDYPEDGWPLFEYAPQLAEDLDAFFVKELTP